MTDYASIISKLLSIQPSQVAAAIGLLDDDNTIPFIARYRKEATGTLDEEQLRTISSELERLRALDERRTSVMASIEEQGKMTEELQQETSGSFHHDRIGRSVCTLQAQAQNPRQRGT